MFTTRFTSLLLLLTTPLALSQCVPSAPPYTSQQYNITVFSETLSSQRPPNTGTSSYQFDFYDPNTCCGPVTCKHEWRQGLGEPGPRDAWWPCSEEYPNIQVIEGKGVGYNDAVLQVKYKYTSVGANNVTTEYNLHGNGTLTWTGHCSSSGTCRYGWGGVPSYLDVVEEEDWVAGQ